jgi:hypothetical protein
MEETEFGKRPIGIRQQQNNTDFTGPNIYIVPFQMMTIICARTLTTAGEVRSDTCQLEMRGRLGVP